MSRAAPLKAAQPGTGPSERVFSAAQEVFGAGGLGSVKWSRGTANMLFEETGTETLGDPTSLVREAVWKATGPGLNGAQETHFFLVEDGLRIPSAKDFEP